MTGLTVLGLLSGTSADGIDAGIFQISGAPPLLSIAPRRWTLSMPFAPALRERILTAMQPGGADAAALCLLNAALGEAFADAAQHAIALAAADGVTVDLIGSHGQTIWHAIGEDGRALATLQLGEAALIAERTGLPVIDNLRARDIAAGGQGAPLVGFLDHLLLRHPTQWRAAQNIGGISNVTFLPPLSQPDAAAASAFDTGPGNAVIDAAVTLLTDGAQTFDADGAWAAQGTIDAAWLAALLAHPYYQRPPPKSTGRELFGTAYAAERVAEGQQRGLSPADILATLTALTAHSAAAALTRFAPAPIAELVIAGGGRKNHTLLRLLADHLPGVRLIPSDVLGLDGDFKEALLFAVIAYETWHGRPATLPTQTGARHSVVLGRITPNGEKK